MKRKRKKIQLLTAEERAAMAERHAQLLRMIKRLEIELSTGKRPAA